MTKAGRPSSDQLGLLAAPWSMLMKMARLAPSLSCRSSGITVGLKAQTAFIQAGAGVVADSVPAAEYAETLNKAMGLLRAVELAETQL